MTDEHLKWAKEYVVRHPEPKELAARLLVELRGIHDTIDNKYKTFSTLYGRPFDYWRDLEEKQHDKPKLPSSYFQESTWDCTDSPTGKCMYTDYVGEYCCIFCGDPNERK